MSRLGGALLALALLLVACTPDPEVKPLAGSKRIQVFVDRSTDLGARLARQLRQNSPGGLTLSAGFRPAAVRRCCFRPSLILKPTLPFSLLRTSARTAMSAAPS